MIENLAQLRKVYFRHIKILVCSIFLIFLGHYLVYWYFWLPWPDLVDLGSGILFIALIFLTSFLKKFCTWMARMIGDDSIKIFFDSYSKFLGFLGIVGVILLSFSIVYTVAYIGWVIYLFRKNQPRTEDLHKLKYDTKQA